MIPHINTNTEKRFIIALVLTSLILAAEVAGGIWTGSLALLSDAAHVFMDVFALGLSYLALRLSALPPDDTHTYGYHRLEVLAALVNGLSLAGISITIFSEAYQRFQNPGTVLGTPMLIIAVIGLVVNLVVAYILSGNHAGHDHSGAGHERKDLNVHSAFLHVLGDAVSSIGVIVAGIIISITGWTWVDPTVSVLIGLMILLSSGRVLRSSLHILIEGTPEGMSLPKVSQAITEVPGVMEVHDLHVWNICSGHIALSAHVVLCGEGEGISGVAMQTLKERLSTGFGIEHTTVQFENAACGGTSSACRCR